MTDKEKEKKGKEDPEKWEDPERRKNLLDRLEDFLNSQLEKEEDLETKVPVPPEEDPEKKEKEEKKQSKGFLEWLWG